MQEIHTLQAPEPIGPYSQAVKVHGWLYLSGQLGIHPVTRLMAGDTAQVQAEQALKNIKALLEVAGGDLGRVVKTTIYLTDLKDFPEVNRVYQGFFNKPYPARSTVQVAGLPAGSLVEIEVVAQLEN